MTQAKYFKFFAQFTDEQIKAQYKKNAEGIRQMLNKAISTGKKVNGYYAYQLEEMLEQTLKLAE
jgi:hypothetical protein